MSQKAALPPSSTLHCGDLLISIRFVLLDLGWALEVGEARHLIVIERKVIQWATLALCKHPGYTKERIEKETLALPQEREWRYFTQRLDIQALTTLNSKLKELTSCPRSN